MDGFWLPWYVDSHSVVDLHKGYVDVHTVLHLHLVWDLHKGYLDLHTVLD